MTRFMKLGFPLLATGCAYWVLRKFPPPSPARIRIAEPYLFDLRYFGIQTPAGKVTPNEWLQSHSHWILDLLSGFFYLGFLAIFFGFVTLLFFHPRHQQEAIRSAWQFFAVNILGYATYLAHPAAPPWFVSRHGWQNWTPDRVQHLCQDLWKTLPDPAGCARVDQLLGIPVFQTFYRQSSVVFGAIPSLHVAYPLLALLAALRIRAYRFPALIYYLAMFFSAVYLNHHYVVDLLLGSGYALLVDQLFSATSESLKS